MADRQLPLICSLLLLMASAGSPAAVYSWKDDQGRVHFGDRAPEHAAGEVDDLALPQAPKKNDLVFTLTEHGRSAPPGLQARAETSIRRILQVYHQVFGLDLRATVVVSAHLFDDTDSLRAWSESLTGKSTPRMLGVYLVQQRMVGAVDNADNPDETLRTLVHEANHVVLAQLSPNAPLWLHEGLSQYFEGIDPGADHLVVQPHKENDEAIRYLIANKKLIQAHEYLAIPAERWRQIAHLDQNPMPYVVAWSLTSFLMSQPVKRQLLTGMLQNLEKSGTPPDIDAFARRYPGGLTMLEYDWFKWAMAPARAQTLD